MAADLFGAIDVGSDEITLTIAECSAKRGIKVIDQVTHRINLGSDTFATGKISAPHVRELKKLLSEYREILKNYGVSEYRAYGTSAIREMVNRTLVLNEIEQQTGIHIDVLSNSEQRFLDYKSVAARGESFSRFIEEPTAIIDIGGSSIQISLFDRDRLIITQHLRLGVLRLYSSLRMIDAGLARRDYIIEELVNSQLTVFRNLYLRDRVIRNIIVVDDYLSPVLRNPEVTGASRGRLTSARFMDLVALLRDTNAQDLARRFSVADDNIPLAYVDARLIECVIGAFGAQEIWAPGVTLCDGMIYEYCEKKKYLKSPHDFEDDIVACAQSIAQRYLGLEERHEQIEKVSLALFDSMKKYHGLGKRERLLLRIAAILHDCGKYVSIADAGDCGYDIVMATEIIGLSHREREIVANVIRYNHSALAYYEKQDGSDLDRDSYLLVAKLTAFLSVANGLERSHLEKFKDLRITVKENELCISVPSGIDLTLEKGMFSRRADFFEEVYGIRPVIRQKR